MDKEKRETKGAMRGSRKDRGKLLFILILFFSGIAAGALGLLCRPPEYEGSARIAFVKPQETGGAASSYNGWSPWPIAPLEVLRSRETAKRLWQKLHPQHLTISEKDLAAFQKRIHVAPPPGYDPGGAEVLVIRVRERNPERAALAANQLPWVAASWAGELETEGGKQYLALLENRIHRLEAHIQGSGGEVTSGVPGTGKADAGSVSRAEASVVSALVLEIIKTQAALKEVQSVVTHLQGKGDDGSLSEKAIRTPLDPGLLWERLSILESRLERVEALSRGVGEPNERPGEEEKEVLRGDVGWPKGLAFELEKRKLDLIGLQARLKGLEDFLDRRERDWVIKGVTVGVGGGMSPTRDLYRRLLEERERLRFFLALGPYERSSFIFLEKAVPPHRPAGPARPLLFLFSAALGVAIGGMGLLFRRLLGRTLKVAEDVEVSLKVPVLGTVSKD